MFAASSKRGFTLIEVVGACAAFTIAFLAGSAAFARLLQQQTVNYHRTLASAAAMLLADWHVDAGSGAFLGNTSPLLDAITPGPQVKFKGADYITGDSMYVFKPTVSLTSVYASLIITVSPQSAQETPNVPGEADEKMTWRQLTFWYGSPNKVQASGPCSVEYIGRYLVPDEVL